jgi:hypothetical protein
VTLLKKTIVHQNEKVTLYDFLRAESNINLIIGLDFSETEQATAIMDQFKETASQFADILLPYNRNNSTSLFGSAGIQNLPDCSELGGLLCYPIKQQEPITSVNSLNDTLNWGKQQIDFSGQLNLLNFLKTCQVLADQN